MTRPLLPDQWRPRGVPSLEQTALDVVKSDESFLVVAGPGAGKTEMLAQRASFLLETGICKAPQRVLAISFKSDAAKNLQERVERRCGKDLSRRLESHTFDAWSKGLLDRFRMALPENFRPTQNYIVNAGLSNAAPLQQRLLAICGDAGITPDRIYQADLQKFYRRWIDATRIIPEAVTRPGSSLALARALWNNVLFAGNRSVLDFVMIRSLAELILRTNPRLLAALRMSYRCVFLDEFQDTTTSQFALLATAFSGSDARVTAVGDSKQRIMLWAGAQRNVFDVFEETFEAERRSLRVNYRSAPRLIAIQNQLIVEMEENHDETMLPPAGVEDGGECQLLVFDDDDHEARHLSALMSGWIHQEGLAPEDVCILVRANAATAAGVLRPHLNVYGLAARSLDALQDLLAEPLTRLIVDLLKVCCTLHAPDHWHDLVRTYLDLEGLDDDSSASRKRIRLLNEAILEYRRQLDTLRTIDQFTAWINTVLNFFGRSSFIQLHERYLQADFLNRIIQQCSEALIEARTRKANWPDAVDDFLGVGYIPVMSIHKSKGLEFHTVLLVGLEDWPFRGLSRNDGEEECAVFVAFSRAKQRILITSVENRQGRAQTRDEVARFFNAFERAGVIPEFHAE